MSISSTSSSRFPRISTHGVPTRCWCGEGITTFGSSTPENRFRRFYRCQIAIDRKSENHLFKWIDEALLDEIKTVDAKHERLAQGIKKFEERLMENLKSELARREHEMTQKLKENMMLEIEKELKQKVKIAAVAVVVVGAILGIWNCLAT